MSLRTFPKNAILFPKESVAMTDSAVEALQQIHSRHYDTELPGRGIHGIVKYGIAFAGKKVEIAM